MAIIDLTKLLVVQIFNEKVNHFFINCKDCFSLLFAFLFFGNFRIHIFSNRTIDNIDRFIFLRNKLRIPANEEVIPIQIRSTDHRSNRNVSFLGKDNTVYIVKKEILIIFIFTFEPCLSHLIRYASHLSHISWMQAGISCDNHITFNMLFLR